MIDTSYEHRILSAALRLEAAQEAGNVEEAADAINEIVAAARGVKSRRQADADDFEERRRRVERDGMPGVDARIVYDLDRHRSHRDRKGDA